MKVEVTRIERTGQEGFISLLAYGRIGDDEEVELFHFFGRQDEPEFCQRLARAALIQADICLACTKHPATVNWVGEGGVLAFTHGHFERWCECCSNRAALVHCREAAARIPEIEKRLEKPCVP